MRTLSDFLGNNEGKKPIHREFFLADKFKEDPRKYCPFCESNDVQVLRTHNPDGLDYKCNNCNRTYTLNYFNRGED